MKNHKRLLVSQCKYTKTPMSKFECFGHAVKGQCYFTLTFSNKNIQDLSGAVCGVFKTILRVSILQTAFHLMCTPYFKFLPYR